MKSSTKFILVLSFIGLLILPNISYADAELNLEGKIELKKENTEFILKSFIQGLVDKWMELPTPEEQAILIIISQAIKVEAMNYLLVQIPKEIGKIVINATIDVVRLILTGDFSIIINKIEKISAQEAKEYLMDLLLQGEIKVGKGNLQVSYPIYVGGWQKSIFPYIIVYHPLDSNSGEVGVNIYSSEIIKAPDVRYGFQYEGGIEELPPFIIKINGRVERVDVGFGFYYKWIKGPEINIIFDQPVPKFEFNPPTIIERIENYFNKIRIVLSKIREFGQEIIDSIFSFISESDSFEASVVPDFEFLNQNNESLPDAASVDEVGREEISKTEEDVIQKSLEEISVQPETLSEAELKQFEEMLDDIAERIDILNQQIVGLAGSDGQEGGEFAFVPLSGATAGEVELASETVYKTPEQFPNNKINNKNEQDKKIITTKTRSSSGSGSPPEPSYCSLTGIGQASMDKVIFDEIAWMGTSNSSNDEWIRIKNLANNQIDISGWQILDKDSQIKIIFGNGSLISANGLYLLERTDDDSFLGAVADLIYTGALNDADEALYLFDKNCLLQDKIIADPDWPGGDKENKTPMKRNQNLTWYVIDDEDDVGDENDVGAGSPSPENEGGETPPLQPEPEPEGSQQIIINEVAWMGTKASPSDEWIELYNNADQDISLIGWKLKSSDNGPNIIFDEISILTTATISSHNFYLLERTDNDTISDILADWYGSFGNGLGNNPNCEILSLYNQNDNLIDQTVCLEDGNWPAGKANPYYISMERFGNNEWTENNLIIYQGKDVENNQIWGTPRAKNSIDPPTEIFKQLPFYEFDEITLAIENSPYIVKINLEVPEGKILNIEPGAVLKFYDNYAGLLVNGALKAIGAENEKIIFTSFNDNPYPGSWDQIYFSETSKDSELNNVIIQYAGGGYGTPCSPDMAGIWAEQSSIILKNSIVEKNQYAGLSLTDSSSLIDNVQFLDNTVCWGTVGPGQQSYGGSGLVVSGGTPAIENSLIKSNPVGLSINNGASPEIKNNIFEENEKAAYLLNGSPYFAGNQAINNEINGVFVRAEISQDTVWEADLPYIINSNLNVFPGVVFTVKPGAIVKFYNNYSRIDVQGTLKAIGTENEKIIFTSYNENPYPGSWDKIYFSPTSIDSELNNVIVRYGGGMPPDPAGGSCSPNMAGIRIEQSSIILKNSLVEKSQYAGLSLTNSSSLIDNVQFLDNPACQVDRFIYGGNGVQISSGSPTVRNSIFKKHRYGIGIRDGGVPILENLIFGTGEEKNECNIFQESQCIDPVFVP